MTKPLLFQIILTACVSLMTSTSSHNTPSLKVMPLQYEQHHSFWPQSQCAESNPLVKAKLKRFIDHNGKDMIKLCANHGLLLQITSF